MQEKDEDIGPIRQWQKQETRPDIKEIETNSPATRHYWFLWGSLKIIDGLLYKRISTHRAILPFGSFKLKSQINAW
jgi:hypothetical protein